ncbi:MAG: hypothetical protein NUW37_11535 [Planctomycetes bacterium]|nr:hypothetical protein [Planctomycetota bacterium]
MYRSMLFVIALLAAPSLWSCTPKSTDDDNVPDEDSATVSGSETSQTESRGEAALRESNEIASAEDDEETPGGTAEEAAEATPALDSEDSVKAFIETLIADMQSGGKPENFADRFVYRGEDAARKWKDTYSAEDQMELAAVEGNLRELQRLLENGALEFVSFETGRESEGTWLVWTVKFGEKETAIACLQIDGKLAVGDID